MKVAEIEVILIDAVGPNYQEIVFARLILAFAVKQNAYLCMSNF